MPPARTQALRRARHCLIEDCRVDDDLIEAVPFFYQTLLKVLDVSDSSSVNSILQQLPDLIIDRVEI